jgi:cytochrome c oxidase cbb3-type subunit 3
MSTFWSLWIIGITLINLGLIFWVLMANRKVAVNDEEDPENRTTGHVYDGIEEFDNPLPKWWFQMFLATFAFTAVYLLLYPGLGSFPGVLGWTSTNQLEREEQKADARYSEIFGTYSEMSIEDVAQDPKALKMGVRLFANNCAVCHGADGGGNLGFPNLTDKDWLYGGTPEKIKESIQHGRSGQMPAWGAILGEEKIAQVSEYVLSLGGREHDAQSAAVGQTLYTQSCVACHAADGTGSELVGAPNLTDDVWLYDGSPAGIRQSLRQGRTGMMPAQKDMLREDKIHLLAAYVYNLSLDYE